MVPARIDNQFSSISLNGGSKESIDRQNEHGFTAVYIPFVAQKILLYVSFLYGKTYFKFWNIPIIRSEAKLSFQYTSKWQINESICISNFQNRRSIWSHSDSAQKILLSRYGCPTVAYKKTSKLNCVPEAGSEKSDHSLCRFFMYCLISRQFLVHILHVSSFISKQGKLSGFLLN